MSHALRKPMMTQDEFFLWAAAQEAAYEFDGFQPVLKHGGTVGISGPSTSHSAIATNLVVAPRARLVGRPCRAFTASGIATIGDIVRYPDALVTCSPVQRGRVMPEPVVVFEIISASAVRTDRSTKTLEYRAVPSIQCYVIVEQDFPGLTVLDRAPDRPGWLSTALTADGLLRLPAIGIEVPVAELYEDIDLLARGGG